MTEEIIESVNKDVLKGFKTLQKTNSVLYTIATDNYLTSISDKTMLIYANAKEIDFKGTFKLTRNKLIPVEHNLITDPESTINIENFDKLKTFEKNMIVDFQKYCYEKNIHVNIADIIETIERLLEVYSSFTFYINRTKSEVMLYFSNKKHKTYLISKLI